MVGALSQSYPFVHPAIAAGALACGLIPVVIHLINRRRDRRVPWAAMAFLLAASRRSAKRMWIEQWLLLALRVLLIVLLGWAIARPYLPLSAFLPNASSRIHRVIVLDNSGSMNADDGEGGTRFDRAKVFAKRLLATFDAQDAISLVTLAEPAEAVIDHAAYDHRFAREQIAATQSTHRTTDVAGGVAIVESILRESRMPPGAYAVYVVSDFARNDWQGGAGEPVMPAVAAIKRLSRTDGDAPVEVRLWQAMPSATGNIVVSRLATESALVGTTMPVRVTADVSNFGETTLRGATLQLRRDAEIVRREPLPALSPGQRFTAIATTMFSGPGSHTLEARVILPDTDALAADNARYLALDVRDAASVLLVDGRSGSSLIAGQVGYLATALSPARVVRGMGMDDSAVASRAPFSTRVISPGALANEDLSSYDAIALCNIGRLSEERWGELQAFVSGGGGLFVSSGDLLDADNYNRYGFADGTGVLPGKFDRAAVANATDDASFVSLTEPSQKIVAEFSDHGGSGLFLCRVDRYLPFVPSNGKAAVALTLGSDVPLLVTSSFGAGRVVVLTTTANMAWTNLPAKGDFVSLMFGVFSHLVRDRQQGRNVLVGADLEEPLSAVQSSMTLRLTMPTGETAPVGVRSNGSGLSTTFGPMDEPGFYTLSVGRDRMVTGVNLPASESRTAMIAPEDLARLTGCAVHSQSLAAFDAGMMSTARVTELSTLALYVVLALLMIEPWIAMWFAGVRDAGVPRQAKPESRHAARVR